MFNTVPPAITRNFWRSYYLSTHGCVLEGAVAASAILRKHSVDSFAATSSLRKRFACSCPVRWILLSQLKAIIVFAASVESHQMISLANQTADCSTPARSRPINLEKSLNPGNPLSALQALAPHSFPGLICVEARGYVSLTSSPDSHLVIISEIIAPFQP